MKIKKYKIFINIIIIFFVRKKKDLFTHRWPGPKQLRQKSRKSTSLRRLERTKLDTFNFPSFIGASEM